MRCQDGYDESSQYITILVKRNDMISEDSYCRPNYKIEALLGCCTLSCLKDIMAIALQGQIIVLIAMQFHTCSTTRGGIRI